jgi:hypothetical protein
MLELALDFSNKIGKRREKGEKKERKRREKGGKKEGKRSFNNELPVTIQVESAKRVQ